MNETKPGAVPALGFSAGAGTLAYAFLPGLATAGLEPAVGIAALSAVIAPLALIGGALIKRAVGTIQGAAAAPVQVKTNE